MASIPISKLDMLLQESLKLWSKKEPFLRLPLWNPGGEDLGLYLALGSLVSMMEELPPVDGVPRTKLHFMIPGCPYSVTVAMTPSDIMAKFREHLINAQER